MNRRMLNGILMPLAIFAIIVILFSVGLQAQTTSSITGTIKDISGATVTAGKIVFTMKAGTSATIFGSARLIPSIPVTCKITGAGIKANDGVSTCTVTINTAATLPVGSSYQIDVCPYNACTSRFSAYITKTSYDFSTITAVPLVDPFESYSLITNADNTWSGSNTFTGSLNAQAIGSMQVLGQGTNATLAAAIANLPSSGGTVLIPAGTYSCGNAVINKPVVIRGVGSGGFDDNTTFTTFKAASVLQNTTTANNCITISVPASNSLGGVLLEDFSIQGNRLVALSTAGDNIHITGGSSPSINMRNVTIRNVMSRDSKGNGLVLAENTYMTAVYDSHFYKAGSNGIAITTSTSGIPSQNRFYNVVSDLNTGDAFNIASTTAQDISIYGGTFADSINGIKVTLGSVNVSVHCDGCNFENNSGAGVYIEDGFNHTITNSKFNGDGHQQYGLYVTPPSGANFVNNQVIIGNGNDWSGNTIKDIFIANTAHRVIMWPQAYTGGSTPTVTNNASTGFSRIDVWDDKIQRIGYINVTQGIQVNGSWYDASQLADGVTGTGNVVRATTPTINGDWIFRQPSGGTHCFGHNYFGSDTWQICTPSTDGNKWEFRLGGTMKMNLDASGRLSLGASGSPLSAWYSGTGTLTYTSIAAVTCQEQPLTITGAAAGDECSASPAATVGANVGYAGCRVSAANTAQIKICNPTAGAITPTAVSWTGWARH